MDAERWLASELASFGCAACGQAYGLGRIQLIAQREELFFVDLACEHCGSQAVAIVTIQPDGDRTDLQAGEWVRVADAGDAAPEGPPIDVDDVLDAHQLLDTFRGDAHQLIARFDGRAH
jgi:hypothetical protein